MDEPTPRPRPEPPSFATVYNPDRADVVSPDARSLRGLAHPLRLQLLGLLRVDGPATATQLAVRTNQSSGATSYHLRQLAAYGFVIEDTERTTGKRDRYWRAAHRTTMFDPPRDADEETLALGEEYLRIVADANARIVQAAIAGLATIEEDLGEGWREGFTMSDLALRLTADEARSLITDLETIAVRYRRDDPDARDAAPAASQRVVLQFQVLPVASPAAPASAASPADVATHAEDDRDG